MTEPTDVPAAYDSPGLSPAQLPSSAALALVGSIRSRMLAEPLTTGVNSLLFEAMRELDDTLRQADMRTDQSLGVALGTSRQQVVDAMNSATSVGDAANYVAPFDGRTYTTEQALCTMHRQVLCLGTVPTLSPVTNAKAPFSGPTWRAQLDQGMTKAHGVFSRNPLTLPTPPVVPVQSIRRGERYGWALGAYLPLGGLTMMANPLIALRGEGEDYYYGFSLMLGRNFPIDVSDSRQVVADWSNTANGRPLALQVRDGGFRISNGIGIPDTSKLEWYLDFMSGQVQTNRWYDFVVRIKFSTNPKIGRVEVWVDGDKKITWFPNNGTLYTQSDGSVLSLFPRYGFWSGATKVVTGTAFHSNWAEGKSMASVLLPAAA